MESYNEKQVGYVEISLIILEQGQEVMPGIMEKLFKEVRPIGLIQDKYRATYKCLSYHFRELKEGEEIPFYYAIYNTPDDTLKFEERR